MLWQQGIQIERPCKHSWKKFFKHCTKFWLVFTLCGSAFHIRAPLNSTSLCPYTLWHGGKLTQLLVAALVFCAGKLNIVMDSGLLKRIIALTAWATFTLYASLNGRTPSNWNSCLLGPVCLENVGWTRFQSWIRNLKSEVRPNAFMSHLSLNLHWILFIIFRLDGLIF